MDDLNEAYLDRLVSKMEASFENLSEFEKLEYVRRIKKGLSKVMEDSYFKYFKDGYREMGNNYIDRNVIQEIASEYREVIEYIDDLGEVEEGEARLELIKTLEAKLKETSFHDVRVDIADDELLKSSGYTMITLYLQPLRGMGIFQLSLMFNGNVLSGLDNALPMWDHKQNIENYDTEVHGDEYIKDDFGQTKSVKSKEMGWDKETPLV